MKQVYMAEDGTIFINQRDCIEYEKDKNIKTRVSYYTESILKFSFTVKLWTRISEKVRHEDILNDEKVQEITRNFARDEFFIRSSLDDDEYDVLSTNVEVETLIYSVED